jgi:hypothetical protein
VWWQLSDQPQFKIVILSEAKDLLLAAKQQVLRFAQDDKLIPVTPQADHIFRANLDLE